MKIAVSGSHGLIGSGVVFKLIELGHHVIRLERSSTISTDRAQSKSSPAIADHSSLSSAVWNPEEGLKDPEQLEGLDAVIHLAGKGIGDVRWTAQAKRELTRSRVGATERLAQQLASLSQPPRAFVSASGVGIYGDRGATELEESEPAGQHFLGQLAEQWEHASHSLHASGTRICFGRLGVVLTASGGALKKMLPIFRWGLGGRLGTGKQYWSWIGYEDAVSAFLWLALTPSCSGPYNLVAGADTNCDFTRILSGILDRPAILPVPRFVLRIVMGEMADGLLLDSTRASGRKLTDSGFRLSQCDLETALQLQLDVQRGKNSAILAD